MRKIAILACGKTGRRCTFSGCLKAFRERSKAFEVYGEEELELTCVMRCNGCDAGFDEDFKYKLEKAAEKGVQTCHLGHCVNRRELEKKECPVITQAADYMWDLGIEVVRGTH